jgi:hypothetical protein
MSENEDALVAIKVDVLRQQAGGHEDVGEEGGAQIDALFRGGGDSAVHDFMAERTEDDQSELDIYIHEAGAMADETFGSGEEVIKTYAKTNFLDDLVSASAHAVLFESIL